MSDSGNNDCQLGKGEVGEDPAASFTYSVDLSSIAGYASLTGTWAETYDELIDYIRTEANFEKRFALMHKAESLLMSTGAVAPVYNYVDDWLQSTKLKNVYASPLGFKFFHWSTLED
jgi:oligopeptide transport system substrate-binding protein